MGHAAEEMDRKESPGGRLWLKRMRRQTRVVAVDEQAVRQCTGGSLIYRIDGILRRARWARWVSPVSAARRIFASGTIAGRLLSVAKLYTHGQVAAEHGTTRVFLAFFSLFRLFSSW